MTARPLILLLGSIQSPFVQDDIAILRQVGAVKVIDTEGFGKRPLRTLQILIAGIVGSLRSDLIVSWFADYYAAIPALLARLRDIPFIVIAGGFDVIKKPEIDWGAWVHWHRRLAVKVSFRLATAIWCQSAFTRRELLQRDRHLKPEIIYLGIDLEHFNLSHPVQKNEKTVLTVGLVYSQRRYWVKGVDRWLTLARNNPDYTFRWIGFTPEMQQRVEPLPTNCHVEPPKAYDLLARDYAAATIYCQPSRIETFGRSVLESMLWGCFPLVSAQTALPEVTGKLGLVIEQEAWSTLNLSTVEPLSSYTLDEIRRAVAAFDLRNREKIIKTKLKELGIGS